jgi:outer membrane protein assembly factor BamB
MRISPALRTTISVLVVLALDTGGLVWRESRVAALDVVGWPQDRGDASRSGARIWFGPEPSGQTAWRADLAILDLFADPALDSSPIVAGGTGTIYVGTVNGLFPFGIRGGFRLGIQSLVAFNPDGSRRWTISLDAGGEHYKVRTAPAWRESDRSLLVVGYRKVPNGDRFAVKGRVFLVSEGGAILRTSQEFDGVGLASPLLVGTNTYVCSHPVSSDDVIWKFDSSFNVTGFNAVHYNVERDNIVGYSPDLVQGMYTDRLDPDEFDFTLWRPPLPSTSLDALRSELVQPSRQTARLGLFDGRKLWQKKFLASGTAAIDQTVSISYIPSFGALEAVNYRGQRLWQGPLGGTTRAVAKGRDQLYVSAEDGLLYAFNTSGGLQWVRTIGSPGPVGAPVVARLSFRELVFVVGSQNQLHAFRADGTVQWAVTLDGPAVGSPAISDNLIYVATQRSLYAIH